MSLSAKSWACAKCQQAGAAWSVGCAACQAEVSIAITLILVPVPVLQLFRQAAEQAAQFAREEHQSVRKLHTRPPPDYVDDIAERAKGWEATVAAIDAELARRG